MSLPPLKFKRLPSYCWR